MRSPQRVLVWDLPVRLFHWGIAALFLLNYWVLEAGDTSHEWVGNGVAILLSLRIVWGLIGSTNARFASFWPTRQRLRRHIQKLQQRSFDATEGHNPLGALMVLLVLALLVIVSCSGWMQGLDPFWGEDWVEQVHAYATDTLMLAAALHVVGVMTMTHISGLHLVRTMVLGWRPANEPGPRDRVP